MAPKDDDFGINVRVTRIAKDGERNQPNEEDEFNDTFFNCLVRRAVCTGRAVGCAACMERCINGMIPCTALRSRGPPFAGPSVRGAHRARCP